MDTPFHFLILFAVAWLLYDRLQERNVLVVLYKFRKVEQMTHDELMSLDRQPFWRYALQHLRMIVDVFTYDTGTLLRTIDADALQIKRVDAP